MPTTFTFLGFLHICSKMRMGRPTVWQRTAKDRLVRTLKAINQQCSNISDSAGCWRATSPTSALPATIRRRGPLDTAHLAEMVVAAVVEKHYVIWEKFLRLVDRYSLPRPRIVHRYT